MHLYAGKDIYLTMLRDCGIKGRRSKVLSLKDIFPLSVTSDMSYPSIDKYVGRWMMDIRGPLRGFGKRTLTFVFILSTFTFQNLYRPQISFIHFFAKVGTASVVLFYIFWAVVGFSLNVMLTFLFCLFLLFTEWGANERNGIWVLSRKADSKHNHLGRHLFQY